MMCIYLHSFFPLSSHCASLPFFAIVFSILLRVHLISAFFDFFSSKSFAASFSTEKPEHWPMHDMQCAQRAAHTSTHTLSIFAQLVGCGCTQRKQPEEIFHTYVSIRFVQFLWMENVCGTTREIESFIADRMRWFGERVAMLFRRFLFHFRFRDTDGEQNEIIFHVRH